MTEQQAPTAPAKVALSEMALAIIDEMSRLEAWRTCLEREGQRLHRDLVRRLQVFEAILKTIDLIAAHERQFVAMVTAEREASEARKKTRSKQG